MAKFLPDTPALRAAIAAIDLSMPLMKSLDPKEGDGWSEERAKKAFDDYRKFLLLAATGHASVPTGDIDKAWHRHILDTRAYASDCYRTFGFFLHHFPYFGMRGEQDAKDLQEGFEKAKADWRKVFGEPHPADAQIPVEMAAIVDCNSCGASSCGSSGCVGQTCSGNDGGGGGGIFAAKCSGGCTTDPSKCEVGDDDPSLGLKATTCDMKACKDCYGTVDGEAGDDKLNGLKEVEDALDRLDLEDWLRLQVQPLQQAHLWA